MAEKSADGRNPPVGFLWAHMGAVAAHKIGGDVKALSSHLIHQHFTKEFRQSVIVPKARQSHLTGRAVCFLIFCDNAPRLCLNDIMAECAE